MPKYGTIQPRTMRVTTELWAIILKHGKFGETPNKVILRLLKGVKCSTQK